MQGISNIIISIFLISLVAVIGIGVGNLSTSLILILVVSILVFIATFIRIDIGLYLLIFAMLLSPEIVIGHIPGRDIVIRFDDIIILVVILAWMARIARDPRAGFLVDTPVNKFIFFYILAFIVATVQGVWIEEVEPLKGFFYVLKYIEYLLIYFLVVSNIRSKKQIKRYVNLLLFVCLITTVYATLQIGKVSRISAPFEGAAGEPNTLGGYLVFILSLILGILFHSQNRKQKFFLGVLAAAIIYPFLFTFSRSSYMAIVAMYFFFMCFSQKRKILIFGLILGIVAIYFLLPGGVVKRIKYTFKEDKNPYMKIGKTWVERDYVRDVIKVGTRPAKIGNRYYEPRELKRILDKDEQNLVKVGETWVMRSYIERIIADRTMDAKIGDKVYSFWELEQIVADYDSLPEEQQKLIRNDAFIAHDGRTVRIGSISFGPSASARIISWLENIDHWKEYPFLGWGITGGGFIDGQYIKNLVELGMIGFLAFMALLITIFKASFKVYQKAQDRLYKGLALGFTAGFFSVTVHALTANTFILIRIMEPFWFVAGMVMMLPKLEAEKNFNYDK